MLTPLTTILCLSGSVRSTSPCLPLSLPVTTITGSPGARSSQRRVGCGLFLSIGVEDLRGQADDLHEVALAKLAGHRAEDARASWVVRRGEQHRGVVVETDERSVRALVFLRHTHDDGLDELPLLDLSARLSRLDGRGDGVANRRVLAIVPTGHTDAQDLFRSCVVREVAASFLLDLLGFSTIY